jgi:hypothetical protein
VNPTHPAAEVDAGGDVAELIGAADLELAPELVAEVGEVVRLHEHVAELGVAEPAFPFQARAHGLLREHHVDGEVLADVPKEFDVSHAAEPVSVVRQDGAAARFEVEEAADLLPDRCDVLGKLLDRKQVPLFALPGRITHHPRRPAGDDDRTMAGLLEATQRHEADEAADVQGGGRRIEAAVQGDRTLAQARRERVLAGPLMCEAAPAEVVEEVHEAAASYQRDVARQSTRLVPSTSPTRYH